MHLVSKLYIFSDSSSAHNRRPRLNKGLPLNGGSYITYHALGSVRIGEGPRTLFVGQQVELAWVI